MPVPEPCKKHPPHRLYMWRIASPEDVYTDSGRTRWVCVVCLDCNTPIVGTFLRGDAEFFAGTFEEWQAEGERYRVANPEVVAAWWERRMAERRDEPQLQILDLLDWRAAAIQAEAV